MKAKKSSRATARFNPELFLNETGVGRTVVDLKKNQVLFSQGDPADAVFYIQKGSVKLTVLSQRGKEVLLLLAHFGKDSKPENVVPKISQELLAEMIGTTRSRVNFFMNRFRKLGYVDYNGGLEVHSSLLNVVLHE